MSHKIARNLFDFMPFPEHQYGRSQGAIRAPNHPLTGGAMVAPATVRFRKGSDPDAVADSHCLPARARPFAGLCQWQHPMLSLAQGRAKWLPAHRNPNPRKPHANPHAQKRAPPKAAPLDRGPPLHRAPSRQSPRHRKHLRRLLRNRKRCSRCFEKRRAPLSPRS